MGKTLKRWVLPAPPHLLPPLPSPPPPCRASPAAQKGWHRNVYSRLCWLEYQCSPAMSLTANRKEGEKNPKPLCHKRNKQPEMSFPSRYHIAIQSVAVSEISTCDTGGSSRKTSSRFLSLIKAGPLIIVSRSEIVALYYSLLASNYVSREDLKKSDASRSLL